MEQTDIDEFSGTAIQVIFVWGSQISQHPGCDIPFWKPQDWDEKNGAEF